MRRILTFGIVVAVVSLLAAACGGADPAPTSTPTSTPEPTATPTPEPEPTDTPTTLSTATPTATLDPTATTAPPSTPTSTPKPTETPTPTSGPTPTAPRMDPPVNVTTPIPTPTPIPSPSPTGTGSTATPGEVALGPSKDNTLYFSITGGSSNGAGSYIFVGNTNSGSARRAVIAFDIASQVPAGATITQVVLTLNMSRSVTGAQTVNLHRLLADWGEGASDASGQEGGGANASSGDATWTHRFFSTTNWQTPGGDFSPTVSASTSVGPIGGYIWGSTAQMVADVQGWLDNPTANSGWVLIGNEASNKTTKRFDFKENGTAAKHPVLSISYSMP